MDMWRSETSSLPGSGHLRPRGAGSSYLLPQTVEQGDGPHRASVPHWAPHTTVPPVWSALTTSTSFHPCCRARLDDSGSFLRDPQPSQRGPSAPWLVALLLSCQHTSSPETPVSLPDLCRLQSVRTVGPRVRHGRNVSVGLCISVTAEEPVCASASSIRRGPRPHARDTSH